LVLSGLGSRLGLAGLDWAGLDPGSAALCVVVEEFVGEFKTVTLFLHRQAAKENESEFVFFWSEKSQGASECRCGLTEGRRLIVCSETRFDITMKTTRIQDKTPWRVEMYTIQSRLQRVAWYGFRGRNRT
jgi:hypothetical protein